MSNEWDKMPKEMKERVTTGCILHIFVFTMLLGLGFYLGFGATLMMYGAFALLFYTYNRLTKKENKDESSTESRRDRNGHSANC